MAACDAFPCGSTTCPATFQCVWQGNSTMGGGILVLVINGLLVFVGTLSLGMVIFAGFKYISSQADKKAIDSANKTLFYAALGLFFVLFSFFILNIIGYATGVRCIEPQNVLLKGFDACK